MVLFNQKKNECLITATVGVAVGRLSQFRLHNPNPPCQHSLWEEFRVPRQKSRLQSIH
jgi:hypothetical protein